VAQIGSPTDWTPAGLAWHGVQSAATQIGATSSLVTPTSNADYPADLDAAASAGGAVVITVGQQADAPVQAAAAAHPTTQFFEMDVVVPSSAPVNVHGLVFDEAEEGYLGGFVAAWFSTSKMVGMVGDYKTDAHSNNYAAGFQSGAAQARPGTTVTIAYAGNPDIPASGFSTAAGLVTAGNDVVMASPSLSGIEALRGACGAKAKLVALDTDAWHTVPDVASCLIVSVMKRYDSAAAAAIAAAEAGNTMPRLFVNDVSTGGIALGVFHADLPTGFQASLDALMDTLRSNPPRPTPVPVPAGSDSPSASPA
jgi:basic membrane protein A